MIPKPAQNHLYSQNFRPISILSHISKLFERILHSRITAIVNDTNLLPHHKFGFRKGHGSNSLSYWNPLFNNFNHTTGVLLDVSKAFDRVWHKGLLCKLQQFNIPDYYISLIKSFLTNLTFRVPYERSITNPRPILAGVPQGLEVPVTLLYNIYTTDLPTNPHSMLSTLTDDTAVPSLLRTSILHSFPHNVTSRKLKIGQSTGGSKLARTKQSECISLVEEANSQSTSLYKTTKVQLKTRLNTSE